MKPFMIDACKPVDGWMTAECDTGDYIVIGKSDLRVLLFEERVNEPYPGNKHHAMYCLVASLALWDDES